jgi:hypothetical protein
MKFITATFGQVLYQMPMDEIRPPSGIDNLAAIQAVVARYRFAEFPTQNDLKDIPGKGIIFKIGAAHLDGLPREIASLGIYNDGILVTAVNTDNAELIFTDLFGWAIETFGFRNPLSPPRRSYSSQVVVDFDASIDDLVTGFSKIADLLNGGLVKCGAAEFDLHVARLAISADPHVVRFPAQSSFYIEPRGGVPVGRHRYFSGAPLPTPLHLELLEQIERLLT